MTPEEQISFLLTELHIGSNQDILEINCKNTKGLLGNEFAEICHYIGTDSDVIFIDKMRNSKHDVTRCEFFHIEPDDLKFQNLVFNCVFMIMNGKKEDIKRIYGTLKESLRVVKNDGKVGIFNLSNEELIRLQAYATKHFTHIEMNSKENKEGKFNIVIKKLMR